MEKRTYIEMDYDEFDKLIHDNYPQLQSYEIIADEELHNYQHKAFKSVNGEELDKYDAKRLAETLDGKEEMFTARLLLGDLCRKGIIEPGDYLIDVYW